MRRHLSLAVALAVSALLAGVATVSFAAADRTQNVQAPGATAPARGNMSGMMHERMMADMKASDAKLDALVQQLNAAKGDARIDALVATVSELARQSKAERAHMLEMHQMMMAGHETAATPESSPHAH